MVLSPLILATLAFYAAYCIIVFVYIAIRSVIVFFMGGTPLGDLPEDVEAKRIQMERQQAKAENSTQSLADAITQSQIQIAQSIYAQNQQQQSSFSQPTFEQEEDVPNDEENQIEEIDDGNAN